MSAFDAARPEWLAPDMERIEQILTSTAGASEHPLVASASTHLISAGGKRLRPALVLLTARAGSPGSVGTAQQTGSESARRADTPANPQARSSTDLAAAAVELVHLATLYHDDVMDQTELRRGVPTAHTKWGTEVAVLAGDYLFACGSALGAEAGGEVPGILARAIAEVCEGQIVETQALWDPARPVEDHLWTLDRKTGALFRAACDLGAATAGVEATARRALVTYGERLGRAFQLVDDLLDLVGDPEVIGKEPGTDLKEGVFTFAVLVACARRPELAERLGRGEGGLEEVLPVLRETGALDEAAAEATRAIRSAEEALEGLPEGDWREALYGLADGVLAQLP